MTPSEELQLRRELSEAQALVCVVTIQRDFARQEQWLFAQQVQQTMQVLARASVLKNVVPLQEVVATLHRLATLQADRVLIATTMQQTTQPRSALEPAPANPAIAEPYDLAALTEIAERLRDSKLPGKEGG